MEKKIEINYTGRQKQEELTWQGKKSHLIYGVSKIKVISISEIQ